MKLCNKCKTTKEFDCFNKSADKKDGLYPTCKVCRKPASRALYLKKLDYELSRRRKSYRDNRKRELDNKKIYQKVYSYKINSYMSKRRAAKLQATPKWLTKVHLELIDMKFMLAKYMTEVTDIPHEVDHIIPLLGKNVRGLHVPWNLRVITESENCSKNNKI